MIWLTSRPVPTSIPFEAEITSASGSTNAATWLQTSRTPWLGTTDRTTSQPATASESEVVAVTASGIALSTR